MKRADTNLGLRQSNFNGDSNVKRNGSMQNAECKLKNAKSPSVKLER